MIRFIPLPTCSSLSARVGSTLSKICSVVFSLLLCTLMACQSEPSDGPTMGSDENKALLLEAKQAILALDEKKLKEVISQIDVNSPLADNASLLAWAVETQNENIVNTLLKAGANANGVKGSRFSPLIIACRYSNTAIMSALLNHGAQPTDAIEDGTSAFHLCAATATAALLADMVEADTNVNIKNQLGQTPLMFAANAGNLDTMSFLIEQGADINLQTQEGYSALFFAVKSHDLPVIQTLISGGADLQIKTQDGTTLAQYAVYNKNYGFLTWFTQNMESLLSADAISSTLKEYDRNGHQLLHAATKANQTDLVAALLERGADPASMSAPSRLKWRYEPNFKTEDYTPPQRTAVEIAEQSKFEAIARLFAEVMTSQPHS